MNEQNDNNFNSALNIYPFFKLTYKGVPPGELTNVFNKNSKLIKLLKKKEYYFSNKPCKVNNMVFIQYHFNNCHN